MFKIRPTDSRPQGHPGVESVGQVASLEPSAGVWPDQASSFREPAGDRLRASRRKSSSSRHAIAACTSAATETSPISASRSGKEAETAIPRDSNT